MVSLHCAWVYGLMESKLKAERNQIFNYFYQLSSSYNSNYHTIISHIPNHLSYKLKKCGY